MSCTGLLLASARLVPLPCFRPDWLPGLSWGSIGDHSSVQCPSSSHNPKPLHAAGSSSVVRYRAMCPGDCGAGGNLGNLESVT